MRETPGRKKVIITMQSIVERKTTTAAACDTLCTALRMGTRNSSFADID